MTGPKKTRDELLAARAAREAESVALKEAHELLVLELEDRFSVELGKRGVAFEIVNEDNTCDEGPIVMKLGDPTAHKLWQTKPNAPEDQIAYVRGAVVYPDASRFMAIAVARPEILLRCVGTMNKLFGLSLEAVKGKL